jgi:hypothetical protein
VNPNPSKFNSDLIWDILTILALTAVLVVAAAVAVVFVNPYSGINPFPPPALPALGSLPSGPVGSSGQPTSPTVSPTGATAPVTPSADSGMLILSPTPPSSNPVSPTEPTQAPLGFDFVILDEPLGMPASEYDPARGCDWMGVAGQVYDIQGSPVKGLRVVVRAELDGNTVEMIAMSGTADLYGPSGYEIRLADRPIASSGKAAIQLIDQAGLPLSQVYLFDTSESCDENLILIDFQEIR